MKRHPAFQDALTEELELREVLATARAVLAIHEISIHRKGGFVAVLEFDMAGLDGFIAHLDSAGWMNVL